MRSTCLADVRSKLQSVSWLWATFTLLSCGDDSTEPSDAGQDSGDRERVSYLQDVWPALQPCVICHRAGGVTGYNLVDPFDPTYGIINRKNRWFTDAESPFEFVVKPGSPDGSFLIYKVATDPDDIDVANNGSTMPPVIPRVTPDELSRVKRWIADGAKNDAFFAEQVAPIFGTEVTLGSKAGKCTLCHGPGSPIGLNVLAPFDPEVGFVNVTSALSTKPRVVPGAPEESFLIDKIGSEVPSVGAPMPLNYARLTKPEVQALRDWISQGATDE